MVKIIIPAILTQSKEDFKEKLKRIKGLTDWLQIDIMDGEFVKNFSVKLEDLKKIKLPKNLEIHLMVRQPEKYFTDCQKLKAKRVIWHIESTRNPDKVLREMEKYNFQKGIALNPKTPVEKIRRYLRNLDLVLLLGVTPGFQGQKFQFVVLKKIKELRKISKKIKIGVDGGVNITNIREIARAGADFLVVGNYLFGAKNLKKNFRLLKRELKRL